MLRSRHARGREGRRKGPQRAWRLACAGASLLALACSGSEPPRSADRIAERVAVARAEAEGRPFDAARLSGAVLRDADLLAAAPTPAPRRPARAPAVADAPLPAEIARVLERRASVAGLDEELAITSRDRRRDTLGAALDGVSVLDDPLPPASRLPDLP